LPIILSSFQDYDFIYLITTYYDGKTLDYFKKLNMTENQIKFISACAIQALRNLREKKIIHRDITLSNIIMDKNKYFNIIDFSYSIEYSQKDNKKKYIKTYKKVSAPEMLNFQKIDYNSDYYRLGSIIYYLIFKKYPNTVKIQNNISNVKVNYKDAQNYSQNCLDFLNKLIISDPKKRIGFKAINELKNHPWFIGFDWNNLEKKKIHSPFKLIKNEIDERLCIKISISPIILLRYKENSKLNHFKLLIKKFDYVNKIVSNQILRMYRN
jgi:serine/threonine protein kinase